MTRRTVVCVGAVVEGAEGVLAVRQAPGHSLQGQWTIPWGRLEDGESPTVAAIRETREEANIVADVVGLIGMQELPAPWRGWFALVYLCRHVSGAPAPDGRETDQAEYLTLRRVDELHGAVEPWSAWLMRRVLQRDHAVIAANPEHPYVPSIGYV
ncbi:MAG: NUDIX domain-containing protein [Pseudomonadota bacterium]